MSESLAYQMPEFGGDLSAVREAVGPSADSSSGTIAALPSRDQAMYAETSRRAGRLNAAAATDAEYERYIKRRRFLLEKKFNAALSAQESNELQLVRWHLDRIEDARSGMSLDKLEAEIDRYENIVKTINRLSDEIANFDHRKRNG